MNIPIYVLTIVRLNGSVLQEETNVQPTLDVCYIANNGDFIRFSNIVETNKVIDREFVRSYITCVEKKIDNTSMVGVTQTKFISCPFGGVDAIKYFEEVLNKFLFETRFTHQILDIAYVQNYIVVKYKLRNEIQTIESEKKFESYQKNGIEVKYELNNNRYSLRESSIFAL